MKDVTRTINYEGLTAKQLGQILEDQKKQTVEFTRTVKYDLVTGKIVPGSESPWTPSSGQFTGFTPKQFEGLIADKDVPNEDITADSKDSSITITYKAIPQQGQQVIHYVDTDDNNRLIGTQTLKGTEGSKVDFIPDIPANYEPSDKLPDKITIADGTPIISLKHKTTSNEKTKDVTRTITIVKPDGSKEVIKQIVTFTRTATFDEVTGKITYSDWKFDKSNATDPAKSQWDAYDVPTIAGYTPSQAAVAAKAVEVTTADEAITITYTQDEVVPPIPKPDDGKDDKPDESDKPQPKPTPEPDNNPELPSKPSTDETEVHVHSKDKIKSGPAVIKGYQNENAPLYEDMVTPSQAADRTNRVSPQGTEAEHNSATPTPKAANNQLAKREAKKNNLPQTGEQHTSVGIIGLLAMVLGFFGLTDHKKKKDE